MKKITIIFFLLTSVAYSQVQNANFTISPTTFEENEQITITVSNVNLTSWGVSDIYLWAWSFDTNDENITDSPTNGTWTSSNEAQKLINNGNGTHSISFTPTTFYNRTGIGKIGMLVKAKNGTGDKKSQDQIYEVGKFQLTLTSPSVTTTIINSGDNVAVSASASLPANFNLKANGTSIDQKTNITKYDFNTPVSETTNFELEAINNGQTKTESFQIIVKPTVVEEPMPNGLVDGINYGSDATKATLVLTAPGKEFIHVAASFNNYTPTEAHVMKRDPSTGKFWLEISDLTSGKIETYQYWVYDTSPIANSPSIVKTADPFSTLVLSPFDDPYISSTTYPNLPAYPSGQDREVTVLQTGKTPYNWTVTNFQKPKKEDLVVYEVLIRDFDSNRNYQDLIDRISYFKNLNVNAIQLMPVMEYEGNESWGYNTSFHMALDKFYGTEEKFKEFIDVCHQNGIAVILDVALNHAFGRNPMVRMWMNDPDNDGWGDPSSDNPYFNQTAKHSYNVGSDFNHQSTLTQEYTKRVVKHWIEEFNIDGFRWDLTKGFTQNCSGSDEGCTNGYQQDRVDILKQYADYSWSLDTNHYVIFEHLGGQNEEKEWANYRYNEGKGVILWGKMTEPYSQLIMGYAANSNINGIGHKSRSQFNGPRIIGYPESHDEERIMYKAVTFGNSAIAAHNVKDLNTALSRMSAIGAVSLTIPGPKMIWHFASLGMDISIFACNNGVVNEPGGTDGDCKLDTKQQPQWAENWMSNPARKKIYDDWARMNLLKINEPVFEGDYTITSGSLTPRIDIYNTNIPETGLRNVVVLANFDVVQQTVNTNFPSAGAWVDLMDATNNTTYSASTITLQPGQFKIFGNKAATLSNEDISLEKTTLQLYPNPTSSTFSLSKEVQKVSVFDITGKQVKQFSTANIKNNFFSVTDLNSGIYFVRIQESSNNIETKKLIID